MSIFESVEVQWGGKRYLLPPGRVLRAIARMEEAITLHELSTFQEQRRTVPVARLSMAYSALLQECGATVSDEEVYAALLDGADAAQITTAVHTLFALMIPPSVSAQYGRKGAPAGGGKPSAGSSSSGNSTGPLSAVDG